MRQIAISGTYQRFANISPQTLPKFSSTLSLVLILTNKGSNLLLYGIPKYLASVDIQRALNTAARIVTLTRKYGSIITPEQ